MNLGLNFNQAPSKARGVVIGGPEYVKSCRVFLIDADMAGPIAMKLSGIDQGNSDHVLGRWDNSGVMTHDSWHLTEGIWGQRV